MADAESVIINTEDYIGETEYHTPNRKVTTPEWFILVANFILELPSAVFDQLSSVHKPQGPERLPILRNRESTLLLRTLNEEENTAVFPLSSSTVLKINKGDITKWFVDGYSDAIVNSANQRMLGGGGADGAIHSAAGPELFDACYKVPEVQPGVRCPTGEARITPGFRLLASHVIHTVGPIYGFDVDPAASLKSAYRNSLKLARDNNIKYIAFPAISCGIYGYPHEEAAAISISTIKEFKDDLKEVHFVLFFDEIYDVWLKKAKELLLPWPDSQER
ncbi:macro domain-containing protein VPA0103 isoform X3 [Jatropha curcas]|uniref:macro domain-containing protein VPA0103 isoform X3 n=1 Tax=Jatropha curcas TaxID=180498 RepID=UPI0005FBB690|nr:macro domain-containing protein VPA0103 isoform X3 [Jatropha curcas]